MKVLITGANSILSKRLVLEHPNDEVHVLYYSQPSNQKAEYFPVSHIAQLNTDYNIVYIVSAVITNDANKNDEIYEVNIKWVQSICNRFTHSKVIFFSSVAVYDNIDSGVIDEKTLPSPKSIYGISKLWGEKIVEQHPQYGIIRISSMYDEEMKQTTFLPKIIESAIKDNHITLLGDGSRIQNYIHAKDVAFLAKRVAMYNNNVILLGVSPENHTNKEVAQIIKKTINCTIDFKGEDLSRSVDYKPSNHALYQQPFTTLEQGVKELIQWKIKQY
ncbi:nucleoside-diphosphate-sugar epimerase [Chryseobacterium sp. 7]|uniref:NAD-dependent epimerase/dehydratase family protein n=1 Tax=Chryseobacterium sp. 7 TaxID=2035214 RepID=UPI000EAECA4B|nr:NAD(P)-dependent oxidoreductase [Chryseobacterium sp. 7]RLJ30910.1 nucleoside-diphosphate-sugar epimerase [Chryseobacterium sp. 7]